MYAACRAASQMRPRKRSQRTVALKRGVQTVQLAPIEIEALIQGANQVPDATATTVEMVALERPIDESVGEPRIARGSETASPARGTRRPRTTLRVDEITPPKKR